MIKYDIDGKHRLSQRQKYANDNQYYKDQANALDTHSYGSGSAVGFGGIDDYDRMLVNYRLFNNQIDIKDFAYVCKPYGSDVGDLPANMTNRDIVSTKIKILLGMEMNMPFSWRVYAVNPEATTRKEQFETEEVKKFVLNSIMTPIKTAIEQEKRAASEGRELTPDEQQQVAQEVEQELAARTPEEVKKYMVREHQDPAELLGHQLMQYLIPETKMPEKFNKGFKHLCLSGREVHWVGVLNDKPDFKPVNMPRFNWDKSSEEDMVEDAGWATYEMRMSRMDVIKNFGSELKTKDVDRIFDRAHGNARSMPDETFTFINDEDYDEDTVRVLHCNWIDLMKIGFLTTKDPRTGKVITDLVTEDYVLNPMAGDIRIRWEWVPEAHECYKILDDIFVHCRPVPGQYKTLDNLWDAKLSYIGGVFDALNASITSPMDRVKGYQYLYDIIVYRIELLIASDKGKLLMMNMNAIPTSQGIDLNKFMYFLEANKIGFVNPNEEGNKNAALDINNMARQIDMSLASDIAKYIDLAEYIERKCGESIGVTKQMEGLTAEREAVTNTKQNIVQSSHVIKPLFELHNNIKRNVITKVLDLARFIYSQQDNPVLHYVLDDMTYHMLKIDSSLLESSKYGMYVGSSSKAADAKAAIDSLSQSAIQNQQADLGDIIKIIKSDSITEAEELLEVAKVRKNDEAIAAENNRSNAQMKMEEQKRALEREKWKHEERMIILKAEEDRKTKVQLQTIEAMAFDPNKDQDSDGTPDVLEVAKFGVDADIKRQKLDLDRDKLEYQKESDSEDRKLEKKKLQIQASKPVAAR